MGLIWTVALVIYGFAAGWDHIRTLDWVLLGIFWIQDGYDFTHKRKV